MNNKKISLPRTPAEWLEAVMNFIFFLCGILAVGCVLLISVYMVLSGVPAIQKIGLFRFLFGTRWASTAADPAYGILPFILSSVYGTLGATVIGVPIGLLTAVFLSKAAGPKVRTVVVTAIELLSGIPSVVFGLLGMQVLVPAVARTFGKASGACLLSAIVVLAVMILPSIVSVSVTALNAVPPEYEQGSLALGATDVETWFKVSVPAARSGIAAGIVLGIGMAVDANVIIFERVKEELKNGKTVKSAIDSGFKRAFTAILDSNITTLIACAVLFFLGTGTIVGFATTLGIGVIVSMFTALTVTHFLLNRMVDFRIRNPKAYGLRDREAGKQRFAILKNFKIFGGISALLVVTGLVALILLPFGKNLFNLSIDFAGGTEMEFNMHTEVTQDVQTEVSGLFKDATGVDASSVTSSGDGNEDVLIRSTSITSEQRAAVIDKMLEK